MDLSAYFTVLQYTLMGATFIALVLIFMYVYYGKEEENNRINPLFNRYIFLCRLFIIRNNTILMTVRIMLIAISQPASGPAPKTIGIGPIRMTPPTLPDPPKTTEATTNNDNPNKN